MSAIQAVILGVVQGITEFLPVSSSGHLVLIPEMFGWEQQPTSFDITIHAATLLAIIIYFRADLVDLLKQIKQRDFALTRNLIISTIPAGIIGSLFNHVIDENLKGIGVIVFMLIVVGIIMIFIEKVNVKKIKIEELSSKKALWVGISQAIAFIRGTSRSGITIIGGMLTGLNRKDAARYAFLAGIPIMSAVSLMQLVDYGVEGTGDIKIATIAIGFISAFISGIVSIKFLLTFLQKQGLWIFGIYRIILGLIILATIA